LLSLTPIVYSWGELGHRTVAYLASKHLTTDASELVNTLLANDQGWDISDSAIWADVIRHRNGYTHSAEWHYIDALDDPPNYCNVTYTRDCKAGPGCIVDAIANFTSRINNPDLDTVQQKEALMFIIHFFGDIHQPLHTEHLSRGGNGIKVCFDAHCGERENLHGVWDRAMPHKLRALDPAESEKGVLKAAAAAWAAELYAREKGHVAQCDDVETAQTCALEWASEANAWVCGFVLEKGQAWLEENDLGGEYFVGAGPVIDELVGKAGLRLGAWLNALAAAR
ncbi:phospholipase C/P1 nuclease, partial [Lophium mytilinum]